MDTNQKQQNQQRQPGAGFNLPNRSAWRSLIWIIIASFVALWLWNSYNRQANQATLINYSRFRQHLKAGEVEQVVVTGERIQGKLKNPAEKQIAEDETVKYTDFMTYLPSFGDEELLSILETQGVEVETKPESDFPWWAILANFLPFLLLIGIGLMFFRRMQSQGQSIFNVGRSRAKLYEQRKEKTTFDDVAGARGAKTELKEIIEFLKNPDRFQQLGGETPKGVILVGPPGTGKCVASDTLIVTDKGLIEIQDIPKYYWVDPATNEVAGASLPTIKLETVADTKQTASHWYSLGAQPTLRVTTKQGMAIEGTPEHPVVVMDEGGQLEFRQLTHLKLGDFVAIKYNTQAFGYLREIDTEQAYLMGLITGDGNMSTSNRVGLATTDEEISEFFYEHMRARYGSDLHVGLSQDGITHTVSSWHVKKDLLDAGLSSLLAYDKHIPPSILQAPKDVVVAFLQGLFDADGYFNRYMFGYCTTSQTLVNQVTALLLNLGIVPRLRVKNKPNASHPNAVYEISVPGTSPSVFASELGFRLERKRRQLETYLNRENVGVNTNVDLFYHITELVTNCAVNQRFTSKWEELSHRGKSTSRLAKMIDKVRRRRRISRNALKEFVEAFREAGVTNPDATDLTRMVEADLFFTPVERIEKSFAKVYDFTVPETHSFISNGFISHNTLLARAVAGEAEVPFFSITGSDFMEMFVGVGASRVRSMFEQAKKRSPSIIFIDEIDSIGRRRGAGLGGGHDEREQTLNQLLSELDGFEPNESVIVMAATNRPDILDPALLRPGRFDRRITVELPTTEAREEILKIHARNKPLADDVDLQQIARGTPGFSGADLENLLNEAALLAARKEKKVIEREDVEEARDKVMMGLKREGLALTDEELELISYHEAGHAILAGVLPNADPIHKVTIVPRGRAMGVTQQLPERDKYIYPQEYLLDRMTVILGGRAAEKLVFNTSTSGSENDLKEVTRLARQMVLNWGMSPKFEHIAFGDERQQVFLGSEIAHRREYSDSTAREVDEEVKTILDDSYEHAINTLREHREALERVAKALLEKEEIPGEEILELIGVEKEESLVEPEVDESKSD